MANTPKDDIKPRLVSLWPTAGLTLGYRSRAATYRGADLGYIKTIRLGKLRKVPTDWLEKKAAGATEDDA
jgi:hypothetical protein